MSRKVLQMPSLMMRLLKILYLTTLMGIHAEAENDATSSDYDKNLKNEIGCQPHENWDLLRSEGALINNVCIVKNYQVNKAPNINGLTMVMVRFMDTKIRTIDEKKNTISMTLKALSVWEEPRFKAKFSDNESLIDLPIITTDDPPWIWTLFLSATIQDLKERKFMLDPTLMKEIYLRPSDKINKLLNVDIFSPNRTLVWSRIEWSVTFACSFDFSNFPFDNNLCNFRMRSENVNVTIHQQPVPYLDNIVEKDAEGFKVTLRPMTYKPKCNPILGMYSSEFGINIELKRQLKKYIFQYYMPCIAIVIASSFSYIIPLSLTPGRIALVVTQFLTLTNIFIHQMVSYVVICVSY